MANKIELKKIPENIQRKISELKQIETKLGHLPPEDWKVGELFNRIDNPEYYQSFVQMEKKTELLFSEICEDLVVRNFSHAEIAHAINSELFYEGGPKYCNVKEVLEALGH
ncbi:hypothetical protein [Fluviispira multicolorata]|uniref:Uncharacterized protein n=1 Tax=Fluviispira multicolorata TaxID=2654512 RepID=A0A833N1Y7_9BACT|nr:hypothetical protein [Fluviispira multicolorata]KAB8031852.1 hypothetical protein GCL57_04200 [Fluviispira multicolorata]